MTALATKEFWEQAGFYEVRADAGSMAYLKEFDDGHELLATNDDGSGLPQSIEEKVMLGLYDRSGEPTRVQTFENSRDAVDAASAWQAERGLTIEGEELAPVPALTTAKEINGLIQNAIQEVCYAICQNEGIIAGDIAPGVAMELSNVEERMTELIVLWRDGNLYQGNIEPGARSAKPQQNPPLDHCP